MAIRPSLAVIHRDGRILRAHREHEVQYMASTTKMVVYDYLLTLIDQGKLPRNFIQTHQADAALMMLQSDNPAARRLVDAAITHMGSSRDAFFRDLNAHVTQVIQSSGVQGTGRGVAVKTHIANESGLDDRGSDPRGGDYFYGRRLNQSTALEMAILTRHFRTAHRGRLSTEIADTTDTRALDPSMRHSAFVYGKQGIVFAKTGTGRENDVIGPLGLVGTDGGDHRVAATRDLFIAGLAFGEKRVRTRRPITADSAGVDNVVLALAANPAATEAEGVVAGAAARRPLARPRVNVARGKELFEAFIAEGFTPEQTVEALLIGALESINFTTERGTSAQGAMQIQRPIYERARAANPSLAEWGTAEFLAPRNQARAFKTILALKEQDRRGAPTTTDLYRPAYNIMLSQAATVVQTYLMWNQGHAGGPRILDDVASSGGTGSDSVAAGANRGVIGANNGHTVYKVSDKMLREHADAVRAVLADAPAEYKTALDRVLGEVQTVRSGLETRPHVVAAIAAERSAGPRGREVAGSESFWKNPLVWVAGIGALFVVPSLFGSSDNNREGGGSWLGPLAVIAAAVGGIWWWNSSRTAAATPRDRRRGDLERGSGSDYGDASDVIDGVVPARAVVDAGPVVRHPSDVVAVVDAAALRGVRRPEGVTVIEDDAARQLTLARVAAAREVII